MHGQLTVDVPLLLPPFLTFENGFTDISSDLLIKRINRSGKLGIAGYGIRRHMIFVGKPIPCNLRLIFRHRSSMPVCFLSVIPLSTQITLLLSPLSPPSANRREALYGHTGGIVRTMAAP